MREGKRTVLIAETLRRVDDATATRFQGLLARELSVEEVETARGIIREAGALDRVEDHISTAVADATSALEAAHTAGLVTDAGRQGLLGLMHAAVDREH